MPNYREQYEAGDKAKYKDLQRLKLEPKSGETFEAFAVRATKKIGQLRDSEWGELPEELQRWTNAVLEAADVEGQETPELAGYPEQEAEDEEGTEAEAGSEAGDEETDDEPEVEEQPDAEETVDGDADSEVEEVSTGADASARKQRTAPRAKPNKAKKAAPKPETKSQKPKADKGKAKTMATTTKAKPAAKKAASGGSRISDEAKIKILAKENPHRAGTKLFNYFKKYKDGMTVAAAKKAGIPPKNIAYLAGLDLIKVVAA